MSLRNLGVEHEVHGRSGSVLRFGVSLFSKDIAIDNRPNIDRPHTKQVLTGKSPPA